MTQASETVGTPDRYDLIVIGSGQGGGPLAGAFAKAGHRVALVEREHVGGSCINVGCSPTKTVMASARVANLARRAGDYGVRHGAGAAGADAQPDGAAAITVDLHRVRERKQGIVDSFRTGSERSLAAAGVELVRGHARFVGPSALQVASDDGDRTLSAERIVINTGLRPSVPPIAGIDAADYLTSTSILDLTTLPRHLVVLGGGYVGLEFAQAWRRFGSEVTVVERGPQLLAHEDSDVASAVAEILREDGIAVVLNATVVGVARVGDELLVNVRTGDGDGDRAATTDTVRGSHLLVASGRRPNTDDLGLEAAGIAVDDRGFIPVNEHLETAIPGVYAIGDVKGGPAFTHISYDDFRILRTNLLEGGAATTAHRAVPYTVFIDPQLGAIGLTEQQARTAGHRIRVAKLPMSRVARALEMDETRGFIKAVVDADTQRILGARVLGIEGGEIATLFQLAMMGNLRYTALRDAVFSHPTIAEALNNLFTAMEREG